ncbi:MAG: heavy metal-associated domain-containing protein [Pseudomonadota bacterium]
MAGSHLNTLTSACTTRFGTWQIFVFALLAVLIILPSTNAQLIATPDPIEQDHTGAEDLRRREVWRPVDAYFVEGTLAETLVDNVSIQARSIPQATSFSPLPLSTAPRANPRQDEFPPYVVQALRPGSSLITARIIGTIHDPDCQACATRLERYLSQRREIASAYVGLHKGTIAIVTRPGKSIKDKTLSKLVKRSGYEAEPFEHRHFTDDDHVSSAGNE